MCIVFSFFFFLLLKSSAKDNKFKRLVLSDSQLDCKLSKKCMHLFMIKMHPFLGKLSYIEDHLPVYTYMYIMRFREQVSCYFKSLQ